MNFIELHIVHTKTHIRLPRTQDVCEGGPLPPQAPSVSSAVLPSFLLTWSTPSGRGLPVIGYRVQLQRVSGSSGGSGGQVGSWETASVDTDGDGVPNLNSSNWMSAATRGWVLGLHASDVVHFRMQALSDSGWSAVGPSSQAATVMPPPPPESVAPTPVDNAAVSSSSLTSGLSTLQDSAAASSAVGSHSNTDTASAGAASSFSEMTSLVTQLVDSASILTQGTDIEIVGMSVEPPPPPPPPPRVSPSSAVNVSQMVADIEANPDLQNATAVASLIETFVAEITAAGGSAGSSAAAPAQQFTLGRGSLGFVSNVTLVQPGAVANLTIGRFDGAFGTVAVNVSDFFSLLFNY